MERDALATGKTIFDRQFISEHTGIEEYLAEVDATTWEHITEQSGLALSEIEMVADMYRRSEKVIMCWAMGANTTSIIQCKPSKK
ncbi:hypothetical protein O9993_08760 [Vibrio lentus]|nr:hypothetical protein [Vibrio lentus]